MSDRLGDLVGDHQPDQHRRREHQQRHGREHQRERNLQPGPVMLQPLILRDRRLGPLHVRKDRGVDRPLDHEHQRRRRIQLDHRLFQRRVRLAGHHNLAGSSGGDHTRRRQCRAQTREQPGGGDNLLGHRLENHRLRQPAFGGLRHQKRSKPIGVTKEDRAVQRQLIGDRQGVEPDVVGMFLQVALRHLAAFIQRRLHPLVEPGLDADVEEHGGEDRDQDRRHRRDAAE